MFRLAEGLRALIWAGLFALPSVGLAQNTYTVGGDIDCDFSSIQDAVMAAALAGFPWASIDVARSQTYTGVAIDLDALSIVLTGGFDTCADSTPSGRTLLNGAGGSADAVIDVSGAAAQVTLRNLTISGGDPSAGNFGGGIQILGANQVSLQNVTVNGNQADRGGGIYIDGGLGAGLTIDQDSMIFDNSAGESGGGIHCVNAAQAAAVQVDGDIFANQAVNGGGVYLDACNLVHAAFNTGDGIFFNQATGSGGGAYLTNGATLLLNGGPDALSVVSINTATLDGGGLYVTGAFSSVIASRTQVIDNFAGRNGGGIYQEGGVVNLAGLGRLCRLQRCSRLESNRADGAGGAIYQLDGALTIEATWVLDNSSPDGSLIKTEGGVSQFYNVVAAGNSGATAVMRLKNGLANIYNSTFADNRDMNATLMLTGGSLTLKGSIIWESSGQAVAYFGAATTTNYACLLVHNFPELIATMSFSDPQFVNPAGGNYHLQMESPAVDFCPNVFGDPIKGPVIEERIPDIDGNFRGYDVVTVADEFGSFDLGADEWVDLMFADGFEVSSTSMR